MPSALTWLGAVAYEIEMSGSESTSGKRHGSLPLARYPSVNKITGVRYFNAMRDASIAASKQLDGLYAETIGSGDSP